MPEAPPLSTSYRPRLSNGAIAGLMQVLLWVLLAAFYFAWNNRPNFNFTTPVWPLVLLEMGFAVLLFNSLVYLIIPRWLLRGRYVLALAGGLLLLLTYQFWWYTGIQLITARLPVTSDLRVHLLDYYPEGPWKQLSSITGLVDLSKEVLATTLFPILVSFLAYALIVDRRRLALERNHLRLELSYLKAQLNPQFLFSTLNQLHGLTRTRDHRAGDVVLHLADLLRYTLYETDADRVPLARELEFLDDYLALERLRHPTASITHEVTGTAAWQQLAPLLLHPFYERLFAGLETVAAPVVITSTVYVGAEELTLVLTRELGPTSLLPYSTEAAVLAAQRRLQLQYAGRHDLQLQEASGTLRVHLRLQLTLHDG
ncbi:sensor histidine kinase [Hymenobacter arizonensis]|uniref:Histidine kinase n=1 Tax=Hymenobacter arizonensis TaxID=1227077 RepID=A0A1I5X7X0_HYMAR|nr:sensor histidine kinase [Hymenobacter arizonensis]SFQ28075.1 Histidine kinase [Hymenobacter arizonensis]